jgi:hypothetical protein
LEVGEYTVDAGPKFPDPLPEKAPSYIARGASPTTTFSAVLTVPLLKGLGEVW